MTLALVRHGRTSWNRDRRMQGRADIALDAVGEIQAHAAGELLATAVWARVVTSPLRRAAMSAEIIHSHIPGAEYRVDESLVERDYGEADGLPVTDVWERWPDQDYPGAESVEDATARAFRVLSGLAQEPGASVVVAHGSLLRLGISALIRQPCPRILNGEVVLLDGDGRSGYAARRMTG